MFFLFEQCSLYAFFENKSIKIIKKDIDNNEYGNYNEQCSV